METPYNRAKELVRISILIDNVKTDILNRIQEKMLNSEYKFDKTEDEMNYEFLLSMSKNDFIGIILNSIELYWLRKNKEPNISEV